ncbi:MAG TPA: imidazole glycerol phosphate synthase subunit HisF [Acidobacteriota bacterium]|nr:imidazole glycerol phosphate synthase subunit HisF [Acidobacteriota bacterium]
MLAKRIIPCLDVSGGRVVKGTHFVNLRDAGDPVETAQRYDAEGADELVFLDITASSDRREIVARMVRDVADRIFIPFTVGGGLRSVKDIQAILRAGADKVSLNTSAIENPGLISAGSRHFGSQCIVVAIDARRLSPWNPEDPRWEVTTYGGRVVRPLEAVAWAREAAERGAGEILLTSMDCDGTQSGYDNVLNRMVTDAVEIPVIASGGCGTLEHMADAFLTANVSAVLAASIFHFGSHTIAEAKRYLHERGIPMRLTG